MLRAGGVAEWSIAAVLKTVERESVPWVRIPPPPPHNKGPIRGLCYVAKHLSTVLISAHPAVKFSLALCELNLHTNSLN